MAERKTPIVLEIPTLAQLQELPAEAMWIELHELATHGAPDVQRKANEILNDDNANPTPEQIHGLWLEHEKATSGTW